MHFAVNLKLTQHCEATSFQLKLFKEPRLDLSREPSEVGPADPWLLDFSTPDHERIKSCCSELVCVCCVRVTPEHW